MPWDMQKCRRSSLGSLDELKWYPALDLKPDWCLQDGNQPLYMKLNDGFLFDNQLKCCEEYYPQSIEACMNPVVDPCADRFNIFGMYDENYKTEAEQGYYPDCELFYSYSMIWIMTFFPT